VGRIDTQLDDALILTVRVERLADGPPLTGEVIFLLHPTIMHPLRQLQANENAAEVDFYTEGWFHVAAIVDGGQTVLALDLRQVPNVPKWFKEV
jgi:hypothetical protein